MSIWHATFVQNLLDNFHKEFPAFSFGLEEFDEVFYILVPATFDNIPLLERVVLVAALNELLTTLNDAGIRTYLRPTNVL